MSSRSAFNSIVIRRSCGVFFFLLSAFSLNAADDLGGKISSEVQRIFKERSPAVVRIEANDAHGKLSGTGFFTDPAGTIYTLSDIVAEADEITVVYGDKKIPAHLLVADPRSGVALIKADITSPFIPIGDTRQLAVNSPVMSIGFPVDCVATPSFGIVGGFDLKFLDKYFTTTHIRAIIGVQPGFGGAPLLNFQGEVVGIIISGIGGGVCYAVPIEAAEKVRMDYARFGEPRHGWVGVSVEEQGTVVAGSHVRIAELGENTPAAQAGLKNGDTLLQVGTIKITEPEDVIDASYFLTAGDKVTMTVMREGKQLSLDVLTAPLPSAEAPTSSTANSMKQFQGLQPESSEGLKLNQ